MKLAALSLLIFLSSATSGFALPSTALDTRPPEPRSQFYKLQQRHDHDEEDEGEHAGMSEMSEMNSTVALHLESAHSHGHSHAAPLLEINETQVLLTHNPDPPSYWDYDQTEEGKPAVLYIHIALMCLAFFILLPLALFLKAGRSSLSVIPQTGFLATSIVGLVFGQIYNGLTPNRYDHSSHTSWGWATMVLAISLNIVDVARFALRFTRFGELIDSRLDGLKLSNFVHVGQEDLEEAKKFTIGEDDDDDEEGGGGGGENNRLVSSPTQMDSPVRWSTSSSSPERSHSRQMSGFSDSDTVFDSQPLEPVPKPVAARLRRYGRLVLTFMERLLVVLAYVEVCSGVAVWTGAARERYLNGVLAHVIKGSIFFFYGLLTFARYLGAFSSLGWAWNRHPSSNKSIWTAEFTECFVIFVYGSTNSWMERMGKTGSWSIKDVQHESIAIMFWAGGALGMMLESRTVRAWLSTSAAQSSGRPLDSIPPPASASFPMNPIPAIVIGVTGAAMSAHHQTYQFQVDVHQLWGNLLTGFAVFRLLTYFFLFLRPPASILPSRPPTEALASLGLAAGGIVFILSTEQVTLAAMRHEADDVMAFLCLTVSFILALFAWIAILFALKGRALARNAPVASSSRRSNDEALGKSSSLA